MTLQKGTSGISIEIKRTVQPREGEALLWGEARGKFKERLKKKRQKKWSLFEG